VGGDRPGKRRLQTEPDMSVLSVSLAAVLEAGAGHRAALVFDGLGLMLIEYLFHRANGSDSHDLGETCTSLAIALGNKIFAALSAGLTAAPISLVYQHRLFHPQLDSIACWLLLFIGVEFCYYLHHVAMHKVRWFWATHAVHHSATRLNLSAAVRLGWGGHLVGGFLFYLPLMALGFHPAAVFAVLGFGLLYQFFLHLAYAPRLGPLEWVFNTPQHHHVHHACNPSCIDKNFGATLILFDRMFGTFAKAPDGEDLRFGLNGTTRSNGILKTVFGIWQQILLDALRARSVSAILRSLFGRPA
jgi:sterol desaturase/sphingolipid hydroxylase (fatty acid hydroxylase superfamily)